MPTAASGTCGEVTLTRTAGLYCGKLESHDCKKCQVADAAISVVFEDVDHGVCSFELAEPKVPSRFRYDGRSPGGEAGSCTSFVKMS